MANLYFCHCDTDGIGFGSEDFYGLFIDKSLSNGSSHTCKTYNNEILGPKNNFAIKRVEVFGFKRNLY
jgi:TLD